MTEQVLSTGPEVVYSTTTGDKPVDLPPKVEVEASDPALKPAKRIAKKTTKKRSPRVKAKTEPLHTEVKVDPRVMQAVRRVIKEGKYTKPTIIDKETVIVR